MVLERMFVFVRKSRMRFYRRIFSVSCVLAIFLVTSAFAGGGDALVRENGVLENTQVLLLFLSGLVFTMQSFSVASRIRCILWMGAWFCLSSILRELDVEDFKLPQWVIWVGSGMGRNLIVLIGWCVLGIFAIRTVPKLKGEFGRIARSRTAILVVSAGIALILGALFDHKTVTVEHSKLWEEIFETVGYSLLLLSAIFSGTISGTQAVGAVVAED
jgi:hypothetical protein